MGKSFESYVAFYCAPTLAGIKPSNLFTWRHSGKGRAKTHLDSLREKIVMSDLTADILCECRQYSLILVYRWDMLEQTVSAPEVRDFLSGYGYPSNGGLGAYLEKLKSRIMPHSTFPHEIGVFLGYPLNDVTGFIDSPGKRCTLCGEWKVYENEQETSKLFARYKKCRTVLYERFINGSDIADLVA